MFMYKYLFIFFFLAIGDKVQAQSKNDRQAILTLLEDQRRDWNKGDIDAYMSGYWKNDSLLFVGKNGPTYGWQKTLENYKRSYPDKVAMGFLTFGIKKIDLIAKDRAFVLGSWHLKREKDELKGYFTLMLRKIDGLWKVVADHSG